MALEEVALLAESVDRNNLFRWCCFRLRWSLSARRAWIEMHVKKNRPSVGSVALRKESVDRNPLAMLIGCVYTVALRKESVDRNILGFGFVIFQCGSLSARRAWIEITDDVSTGGKIKGRSPQGERG